MTKFILAACAASFFCISMAQAKPQAGSNTTDSENIEVTPTQTSVTSEELAAIYVLSKLCKSYGFKDQKYQNGYAALVKENLPETHDPVHALEQMAKDKAFKPYLKEAEQDAKKAGDAQNKEICEEISTLSNTQTP
ncbi:MCR_0457 family protein [Acinetobacter sp. MD2]|uniref:MCR_0457 family protein n=1 Tax=Acinetobacter sp. MD2 TaxID=2600066 RepID=UPI002D793030|nr:hypothetical protein [Acinetobacter sp. MD2]